MPLKQRNQTISYVFNSIIVLSWYFFDISLNRSELCSLYIETSLRVIRCYFLWSPVVWGRRIHRLHLYRVVRPPPQQRAYCYDIKQSEDEVSVMQEHEAMWSTPSLPLSLPPGSLWPGVVAPIRVISVGQMKLVGI